MSPLTVPVVCRATSGAQSPSSGGVIVLHQASKAAERDGEDSKRDEAAAQAHEQRRDRAKPEDGEHRSPRSLSSPSGPGNRNHSAIALHALMGAMSTIAAMILRASPAALFTMMDLAPFPAALT